MSNMCEKEDVKRGDEINTPLHLIKKGRKRKTGQHVIRRHKRELGRGCENKENTTTSM